MLLVQQYDALLQEQYQDVKRKARQIGRFLKPDFKFLVLFFVKSAAKKVNFFLLAQAVNSKGLLADIQKNAAELDNSDLSGIIDIFDHLIKINVKLKETVADTCKGLEHKIPEIASWEPILAETIENLYAILRILKRHNHRTPIGTSSLAVELAKSSLTSLETTTYDRRTT